MSARLLRLGARRGLSAQAQSAPASEARGLPTPVHSSSSVNGVLVASLETYAPLTRVAIAIKAGARTETSAGRGATHLLRVAAGLNNVHTSSFMLTKQLQQLGAQLSCSADRETLVYSVMTTRQHVGAALELLAGPATQQQFMDWQVADLKAAAHLDLSLTAPHALLLDDLHHAAFREQAGGLGHRLVASPHQLDALTGDHLHAQLQAASGAAVVGVGVDHKLLEQFVSSLQLPAGGAAPAKAQLLGGESRVEHGGPLTLVAVAGAGPAASEASQLAAHAVLQALLGSGAAIKRSVARGLLGAAAASHGATALGLGAVYSDAGLSGYFLAAPSDKVGEATRAVHAAFKTASFTEDHLKRGKAMAKAALLEAAESTDGAVDVMMQQAVTTGAVVKTTQQLQLVEAVTLQQLQQAHKMASSGKMAMASRGSARLVPYHDEL